VPRWRGGGDRNATHNYTFPNNRVTANWLASTPLHCSSLRSLGGMANTTANEAFLDELAVLAGADPVAFRLRHLDDPRAITVIEKAAEIAGWQPRPSPSPDADPAAGKTLTGRGIAFARYETAYAYVAIVAEVAVEPVTRAVHVTRVCVAHDCGQIINPDGVANQVEGNVIQGISRALKEEVTFDRRQVTSLDFSTYPIATFPEAPELRIALIDRQDEPPFGAGEPAICPVAAAIGNAIYDATGVRLRTVPFRLGIAPAA
jgi:nicotinate dehydrogenase subunit B